MIFKSNPATCIRSFTQVGKIPFESFKLWHNKYTFRIDFHIIPSGWASSRKAANAIFKVLGTTPPGIKPRYTALEADALDENCFQCQLLWWNINFIQSYFAWKLNTKWGISCSTNNPYFSILCTPTSVSFLCSILKIKATVNFI